MQMLGETTLFGEQAPTPLAEAGDSHSEPSRRGVRALESKCGTAVDDAIFWSWEQFLAKFLTKFF